MNALFTFAQNNARTLLRTSLGIVLVWIGALKFADPAPVVGLLQASLSFLAFNGFVYLLGAFFEFDDRVLVQKIDCHHEVRSHD